MGTGWIWSRRPARFFLIFAVCMGMAGGVAADGTGVAGSADMTEVEAVVKDGMPPVDADSLVDGTYTVEMKSSSSMFRVDRCEVNVADGKMEAVLHMTSDSYEAMFDGSAAEAAAAKETDWILPVEQEDGMKSFTLPIEALNAEVKCAALSRRKQLWYDRSLLFRADSLPLDAFREGVIATAESLGLADGEYLVDVALDGGSGRASVTSPAHLTVTDGTCMAEIEWSSPNYDYMVVDGEKYLPVNAGGNAVFEIPVAAFDTPLAVLADTTAMSTPYEISYTLTFDGASISAADAVSPAAASGPIDVICAEQFSVEALADGCTLLTIGGTDRYILVPEGTETANCPDYADDMDDTESTAVPAAAPTDAVVIRQPAGTIYLAASSAMDLFLQLGALDAVRFTSTTSANWSLPAIRDAMDAGSLLYAGKYSAPDFELVLSEGCDLAVESTMIYHSPEIKEKLEELGIPVLVERSSYETNPLGRMEWIKVYGLLTGRTEEAAAFFDEQMARLAALSDPDTSAAQESAAETVAFFYINTQGAVVVRKPGDYVSRMIEMAGGRYVPAHLDGLDDDAGAQSTATIQMEAFYAAARDADILIYNSTIDGELETLDKLLAKNSLLADFKAVQNGNVWCTGKNLFQETSAAAGIIADLHTIITDAAAEPAAAAEHTAYLHKLR